MPTDRAMDTDTELAESHQLGCRLTLRTGRGLVEQIAKWARSGIDGYICVANTHQVVQARNNSALNDALNMALAVTTDSQVLAASLARLGAPYRDPVLYGPDLMHAVIAMAAEQDLSLGLFGADSATCRAVCARIHREYPGVRIVTAFSPPVLPLARLCEPDAYEAVAENPPDILLVSLGCPKQEQWMHRTSHHLPGIKIGLGGAFEFYAGIRARSPAWVHKSGLEWLYRFACEPGRLAQRYLVNNPIFVMLWLRALMRGPT